MNTLDHIAAAVNAALRDGDAAISDHFHRRMDDAARLKFDGFLVRTNDPLAWEAGTCESHFFKRCKRMADLERQRRAGSAS